LAARAAQYMAVDLYTLQAPAGWNQAGPAFGHQTTFAGQVVGAAWEPSDPEANPTPHPVLWKPDGSAEDLNPNGFDAREVAGTDGIHQFGYAITGGIFTPVVWSGSAVSATFLNKQGFASAQLAGGGGGQFVGSGYSQVPGSEHALLWNSLTAQPIDLNPTNLCCYADSHAFGASGNQQVGSGNIGEIHALLWTGSASSAVDLNPWPNLPGITESESLATDGLQQVGDGWGPDAAGTSFPSLSHALLWNGSAGSAVDLNPPAFDYSIAYCVRNGKQVGAGITDNGDQHALVWSGAAASAIDLHVLLPNAFDGSIASAIDDAGNVFGFAYNIADGQEHAIEWLPVAELSGDYNHDGKVDAADYVVWRKNNGSQSDYNTWRSHFGQSAGGGASLPSDATPSATVPEPSNVALVLVVCLTFATRRRT
jgi:hypothetical protein